MKKLTLIVSLIFAASQFASAQDAKQILDKLSSKATSYKSMKATFSYQMKNDAEGIDESQSGSIITQGDKYSLNIAGQQIISDGKTVWTVIEEAEEVQISNVPDPEEAAADEFVSPNQILTLWEKGFKYKYDSEQQLNGVSMHVINLYPENPSEKSFHTIKLFIDKSKMEVAKIVIKGKDGTDFIYQIKEFKTNLELSSETFKFNNPSFDVIDLR